MPLVWSRKSPDYLAFLHDKEADKIKSYNAIVQEHQLDISPQIISAQAYAYAQHEANAHFQVFSDIFKPEKLGEFIASLVEMIVGIALAVFTGGASVALAIAQMAMVVARSVLDTMKEDTQSFFDATTNSLKQATAVLKGLNEEVPSLVQALIYHPYAIFPEGHIYKGETPGSLGHKAGLEAYNPMKGINGVYKENMQAEQINTRSHRHLPGNAHYSPLKLPFPKARFKEDTQKTLEGYRRNLDKRMEQIKKGFANLTQEHFGAFDTQVIQRLFNEHMDKDIHPRIDQINSYDFLHKMGYYAKGERLPLFEHMPYPDALKLPPSQFPLNGLIRVQKREYRAVYRGNWNTAGGGSGGWGHIPIDMTYVFDDQGVLKEIQRAEGTQKSTKIERVILHRALKEGAKLPPKSGEVLRYEAIRENPTGVSLATEYALKEAYNAYLKEYWGCFEITLLGAATHMRPLGQAKSFTRAPVYDWGRRGYRHYALEDIFFNTALKPLNPAEQRAQENFNAFVEYYHLKEIEWE
ncbi:hypothetical protein [Helicobacter mehlei]|uniref:hypothetical protein n=1 Tax=Helicobacter mehlei TaxID=2316080 RepID=UPI001F208E96|nr:hypothetical protein [Helicobacter mehlei]